MRVSLELPNMARSCIRYGLGAQQCAMQDLTRLLTLSGMPAIAGMR
jgi:hypothetical protein